MTTLPGFSPKTLSLCLIQH